MKLLLKTVLFYSFITIYQCERIKLVTQNNYFNFFPWKSDYLEFNVKANEHVKIVLTNSYQVEPPFYEIVLGANGNTLSKINRDGKETTSHSVSGSILAKNDYKKFWIRFDQNKDVIKVGTNYNKPILYLVDENFIKSTHFGVTSYGKEPAFWDFGINMVKECAKSESVDRVIYEKCIKVDGTLIVPETVLLPDVV